MVSQQRSSFYLEQPDLAGDTYLLEQQVKIRSRGILKRVIPCFVIIKNPSIKIVLMWEILEKKKKSKEREVKR